MFALAAAVASALLNFLNPGVQVADHRKATGRYRAIENRARVLWEITCVSDMATEGVQELLGQLVEDWNMAIDASPPLLDRFHRRARQRAQVGE